MPDLKLADLQCAIEIILDKKLSRAAEGAELEALAHRNGLRYATIYRAAGVIQDLRKQRSNHEN